MRHLSLQWRITLMTAILICVTCISMKLLLCSSGIKYMDSIGTFVEEHIKNNAYDNSDPSHQYSSGLDEDDINQAIHKAQKDFCMTNWHITAAVTLLSGVLAYFVSGRALKPLKNFSSKVEKVRMDNLADIKLHEATLPEFRHLSRSFNQMLERLNLAFETQRQFTGNAAHELRTPLALIQAQLELFSAEHPDVLPETADFLRLLREQTERLSQMSKTLLEMSSLHSVPRTDLIQFGPMIEEIFTDLAPLAEERGISLERYGDAEMNGSDTLIYRLLFNLTENAIKYNRPGGSVKIFIFHQAQNLMIRIIDSGFGIPEKYQQSIFHPFFRVDKSRSMIYGGAGFGLSLVWEIANVHGGSVWVEKSSEEGTSIIVKFPLK